MRNNRHAICLVLVCILLTLLPNVGCCLEMGIIKAAIERSMASMKSGYGYFAISYVQGDDLYRAEKAQSDASQDSPIRIQTPTGPESLDKLYWAFDGLKWRFDKRTLVPEKTCAGLSQVAWNGTSGSGLTGADGFISNDQKQTRLQSLIGIIDPFIGNERKSLLSEGSAYVGDETIDKLPVHHFVLRQGSVLRDIWISPQNGYLTKRMRTTPDPGKGRVSIYNVESFRQYDGVWFPEAATVVSYLDKSGIKTVPDVKRFRTLEFHPNASVPASIFTVEFPVGTTVYGPQTASQTQVGGSIAKEEIAALLKAPSVQ